MATSKAKTPTAYLAQLPPERRKAVSRVRDVVRKNLPKGYKETMNWGMITYEIPLEKGEETYNGQPLCYAGLAAHKNHNSLYMMGAHTDPRQVAELEAAYRKAGKRLDMGKSCLRFQRSEDLPLDVIGRIIAGTPPNKLKALYAKGRSQHGRGSARKAASKTKAKRTTVKRTKTARKR